MGDRMRVISRSRLVEFWEKHRDAEQPLRAWFKEAKRDNWKTPVQIKSLYATASILQKERVVFNIAGNKYRLVVIVKYEFGIVYIRFIDTHKIYDTIDALTI